MGRGKGGSSKDCSRNGSSSSSSQGGSISRSRSGSRRSSNSSRPPAPAQSPQKNGNTIPASYLLPSLKMTGDMLPAR